MVVDNRSVTMTNDHDYDQRENGNCALDDGYISAARHHEALLKAESLAKRLRKFASHLSS